MDLEQLTKHQILLLTLLVSFVTSIATGIVTVSLMDQAPEGVTRVINQIVERTVETVTPATQGAAVTKTETVVVTQDDLVPQSIATAQKSVVRIIRANNGELVARGVVVGADGLVVTDRAAVSGIRDNELEAVLYSGEHVPLEVRGEDTNASVAFVNLKLSTTTGFAPAVVADPTKLTLGQTVLRISGNDNDTVGQGVIASLGSTEHVVQASVTSATPGAVLITIFGEVVGIATPSLSAANDMYTIITLPTSNESQSVTNSTPRS